MTTIDLRHVRTPEEANAIMDAAMAKVRRLSAITGFAFVETIMTPDQLPTCRWCGGTVIRNLPCHCDRAQEEARRIRAAR